MGKIKHGACKNGITQREYQIWQRIKMICFKKKATGYKNYGAVGMTMQTEWIKSFLTFVKDVGLAPSTNHTLERIDRSKDFTKQNCHWILKSEAQKQRFNSRQ